MIYFGYGSLVNRLTRDSNEKAIPATLQGWERLWAHRAARPWESPAFVEENPAQPGGEQTVIRPGVCALTIAPNPALEIDGVLVEIGQHDLPALDQRERGYERVVLPAELFRSSRSIAMDNVVAYRSLPINTGFADLQYPLIQSYVDCVISGYANLFGRDGVQRLMASTTGWYSPLVNDRLKPLYPRAQSISTNDIAYIDKLLRSQREKNQTIDYSG